MRKEGAMSERVPRDREQQIQEQGFVDAVEHLAAEALKHAAEAAETRDQQSEISSQKNGVGEIVR
jgi:hypothetical protein